jgi:hypothetical protein
VEALGLALMGPGVRQAWPDGAIDAFEAAITEHGKDFELICSELRLIPGKTVADAVDLFYNVWKTRGLARAAAWYARREQVRQINALEALLPAHFCLRIAAAMGVFMSPP